MYLSRFGVKNYKCLGEIDIPLTPIHVLIGENDAGKTSLLEAMAAFFASSEQPLSQIFPGPWEGTELVLHGSPESTVELWGEWKPLVNDSSTSLTSGLRYGFGVNFPQKGMNCINSGEWAELAGERHGPYGQTNAPNTTLNRWKLGQRPREQMDIDPTLIAEVLNGARKYALDAKLMAVPAAIDPKRGFRLDPDGFGLATLLDDILDHDPELFLTLRSEFCKFFPQFTTVRIKTEQALQREYGPDRIHVGSSRGLGKGIYFETKSGHVVRAQQASDGAILFLGFLALAYLPDPPKLLLIEEPENGIYPKRLGEVIQLLKEMVHRTEGVRFPQIIISTHSPYVLSFFEPEEVTFLSRLPGKPDAPVRARPLRDAPNINERLSDGFYLGELWYNLSEEDLFGGV